MKKKFVSLLLAAALVFSLGIPAFAEGAEALPAEPEAAVAEAEPEMAPEDETNEVVVTLGDTVTATTTEQAPAADTKTTAPAADSTKETAADTESTEQKQITYVALGDSIVAGRGPGRCPVQRQRHFHLRRGHAPQFQGLLPRLLCR